MHVAALVSGGVDSAVALDIYRNTHPHDKVSAYYLKIWLEDEFAYLGNCPWEEDLDYARRTCQSSGVELKVISLQREYYDVVVAYVIRELRRGATPSPDVLCNQHIKFGVFWNAVEHSVEKIISGHYAQLRHFPEGTRLYRSPDPVKDQTYFLAYLSQAQLQRIECPLANMTKAEVREYASVRKLAPYKRKDSQGICFLGKIKYRDFVRHCLGEREGSIVQKNTGKILGTHKGLWFYTIGQREGIGLGGGPWYVVGKDMEKQILYVSREEERERYACSRITVRDINWIRKPQNLKLHVKLRHGPHLIAAELVYEEDKDSTVCVVLEHHDKGTASGQFVVFYEGDECVGSGVIV